ncbi:uncharacterized protein si:ch211-227n13.3 [Antennarius striatus]|uniref:uncharacterized protein si:ch211-227n13.3 n=1 Tax=Antennarius striatus TaxID=241820 RepID=UPI0035B0D3A6
MPSLHKRSSRRSRTSKDDPPRSPSPKPEVIQRSPRGHLEVIQRRLKVKRQRRGQKGAGADDNPVETSRRGRCDIIDPVDDTTKEGHAPEEGEGAGVGAGVVLLADIGVDQSDEDSDSGSSSVASGPSLQHGPAPQGVCSTCWKLCLRAKAAGAPPGGQLLVYDPTSLSCDQWVLIKRRSLRGRRHPRATLLASVRRVKGRLQVTTDTTSPEEDTPTCSRPHPFLQRNLRLCLRASARKERKTRNGVKRSRDGSSGSRAAKHKRLHGDHHHQLFSDSPDRSGGDPPAEGRLDATPRPPCRPRGAMPRQKPPRKDGGFRALLTQMRGNSSVIVRETS